MIDELRVILSVKHFGQVSNQGGKSGENRLFSRRSAARWVKWGKTSGREALSGPQRDLEGVSHTVVPPILGPAVGMIHYYTE